MLAVQVDGRRGQVDQDVAAVSLRQRGRSPITKEARRVGALALVVVDVDLDGDAVADAAWPAAGVRPIAEAAAGAAELIRIVPLDDERHAVGVRRVVDPHRERRGEVGDVEPAKREDAARLTRSAIREPRIRAVERGVAIRGEIAVTGKSRQVVDPAAGDERDTEHGGVSPATPRIQPPNAVEVPTLRQVGIRVTGLRDGEIPSDRAEGRALTPSLE